MLEDSNLCLLPRQKKRALKTQISDLPEQDEESLREHQRRLEIPHTRSGGNSHTNIGSGNTPNIRQETVLSATTTLKILARKPESCKVEQLEKSVKGSRGDSLRVGQRLGIPHFDVSGPYRVGTIGKGYRWIKTSTDYASDFSTG
jgi:hypothetical protein